MSPDKPKIYRPTEKEGAEALELLKAAHPEIWKRWLELEAEGKGLMEIDREVLRFFHRTYEISNRDKTSLMWEIRKIANNIIKANK